MIDTVEDLLLSLEFVDDNCPVVVQCRGINNTAYNLRISEVYKDEHGVVNIVAGDTVNVITT